MSLNKHTNNENCEKEIAEDIISKNQDTTAEAQNETTSEVQSEENVTNADSNSSTTEDTENNITEEEETAATSSQEPEETELEKAQKEIAQLKDQLLRQMAEFDNYRKRTLKEKANLVLNGGEKTITALLPVLDDFERAITNIEKSNDFEQLKTGVDLIFKKLMDTLRKEGLESIDTNEKDFDTDFHEAIAMVPVEDGNKKGKVIDCVQTGYKLNDKVIRHAKVAIGQ